MIKIRARLTDYNCVDRTFIRDLCRYLIDTTGDDIAPNCVLFPVHRDLFYFWGKSRTWEVEELVENQRIAFIRVKTRNPKIESYLALKYGK